MTTSTVTDMSLSQNHGGSKPTVNGGGGGGRRKTKGTELTQKKHKQPQRGMSVEKLERIRLQGTDVEHLERLRLQERWRKMTEVPFPAFNPTVQNVAVQYFRHAPVPVPSPAMVVPGVGIHGVNLYNPTDHVVDPSVIGSVGSSNTAGFRFDSSNSKELYSIPNYMKCSSDACGVCYKKKRISGGTNHCSVNPFGSFCGNNTNTVVEMIGAGKTRRSSAQVTEVMTVHRSGGGSMTEYEFFPGKCGGLEGNKEMMSMGSTAAWCGNRGSVAGTLGLRGGEGSCVTAITGGEEGSVSSLDLSLKLSY